MELWQIGDFGQPFKLLPIQESHVRKRLNGTYFLQELADGGDYGEHYIDVDLYVSEADAWRASIADSFMKLKRVEEQHERLVEFARKRGFAY